MPSVFLMTICTLFIVVVPSLTQRKLCLPGHWLLMHCVVYSFMRVEIKRYGGLAVSWLQRLLSHYRGDIVGCRAPLALVMRTRYRLFIRCRRLSCQRSRRYCVLSICILPADAPFRMLIPIAGTILPMLCRAGEMLRCRIDRRTNGDVW